MKTILLLSLVLMGCGRDESGSEEPGNPVAATTETTDFNSVTQLLSINHRGFETNAWMFDLTGYKVNVAEEGPFESSVIAEMYKQKTVRVTKKFADGQKIECDMHAFIGVIRKDKETGKPSGGIYLVRNGLQEKCNLKSATLEYSFTKVCQEYGERSTYPCATYDIIIKDISTYYGN